MRIYKSTSQGELFADRNRLDKLSQLGDPLEYLQDLIDWEYFRSILEKIYTKSYKSNAGARPYDVVLMFKILVLQRYYNLSDHQLEYQITDRLSFCRFLDLSQTSVIPDEKTI